MTEHQAKGFLTNFGTKIFHTVGDRETAEYASSLLGQRREEFVSYSPRTGGSLGEDIFGTETAGGSFSESYQDVLKSVEVLTGLRQGGAHNGCLVDGIVIRSGRKFASNAQNYLRVAFSQK